MTRSNLSKLKADLSDKHDLELSSQLNGWHIMRNAEGDILFSFKADSFFDADGMHFEDDLP